MQMEMNSGRIHSVEAIVITVKACGRHRTADISSQDGLYPTAPVLQMFT